MVEAPDRRPANPGAAAYRSNAQWARPLPKRPNFIPEPSYLSYNWVDKDPDLEFAMFAITESGMTLEQIEEETGAARSQGQPLLPPRVVLQGRETSTERHPLDRDERDRLGKALGPQIGGRRRNRDHPEGDKMPKTIDPFTLAQFLAQPGAADLIEAYSEIPPGPLRDSIVHTAKVVRLTYLGAPETAFHEAAPPPSLGSAQTAVARALSGPRKGAVPTDDPEVRIVERLLEGAPPHVVAEEFEIPVNVVYAAKKKARQSGVTFPNAPKGKVNKSGRKRGEPYKGQQRFVTSIAELKDGGIGGVMKAASLRGISPEAYMERRKLALEMALAGRHPRAIMEATGEAQKVLQGWFSLAPHFRSRHPLHVLRRREPRSATAERRDYRHRAASGRLR